MGANLTQILSPHMHAASCRIAVSPHLKKQTLLADMTPRCILVIRISKNKQTTGILLTFPRYDLHRIKLIRPNTEGGNRALFREAALNSWKLLAFSLHLKLIYFISALLMTPSAFEVISFVRFLRMSNLASLIGKTHE